MPSTDRNVGFSGHGKNRNKNKPGSEAAYIIPNMLPSKRILPPNASGCLQMHSGVHQNPNAFGAHNESPNANPNAFGGAKYPNKSPNSHLYIKALHSNVTHLLNVAKFSLHTVHMYML